LGFGLWYVFLLLWLNLLFYVCRLEGRIVVAVGIRFWS
jgi:hypothetical protein